MKGERALDGIPFRWGGISHNRGHRSVEPEGGRMNRRWKFTNNTKTLSDGTILHQIQATADFILPDGFEVKSRDLGGWIEKKDNLKDCAWVFDDACVYGDACVYDAAWVCDDARVFGDARVCGDAWVCGNAQVYGAARVCGDAWVCGDARVCGDAWVCGDAQILTIGPLGSRNDTTTFFVCKDGKIRASCGCFMGTLDEFREKVIETHGDTKHALTYLKAADLAELQIEIPEDWSVDE